MIRREEQFLYNLCELPPAFRFTLPAASCSLQSGLGGLVSATIFGWVLNLRKPSFLNPVVAATFDTNAFSFSFVALMDKAGEWS